MIIVDSYFFKNRLNKALSAHIKKISHEKITSIAPAIVVDVYLVGIFNEATVIAIITNSIAMYRIASL